MDLQEIIERCQRGEKKAFEELLLAVEKDALATAYLISGTRGIAEDILQETYIKCFKEITKLKEPEAFKAWFFRILVRTGWEMTKKQSKLVPVDITSENEHLFYNMREDIDNPIDAYEIKYTVQKAINELSDNLKTVIILYYFNDMSIEEISKTLGCLKSTVKSRLFYARNALKKYLIKYDEVELDLVKELKGCNENG